MNIINELQNNVNLLLVISAVLGLIAGSFLNVVIHRLPIMLQNDWQKECATFLKQTIPDTTIYNLFYPRSHCPNCHAPISWQYNIPLFGYLILRGKCNNCQTRIPWRYLIVEALSALTAVLITYIYGLSITTVGLYVLSLALIAITFIDFKHKLIPDSLSLPLLWFGLLLNTQNIFITPNAAIIGAIVGYVIPWSIAQIFKSIRKIDGMGYGDFKLLAVFGAWFGWQLVLLTLTFAAFLGSVVGIIMILCKKHKFQQELPFGPYIALVGWLNIFYDASIWHWYSKILGM